MSGLDGEFRSLTAKVEAWKRQRSELADDLRGLIGSAQALLKELGDVGRVVVEQATGPMRNATTPRRKRRFSREARAKMAAALKKRWAEAKKAGKKRL